VNKFEMVDVVTAMALHDNRRHGDADVAWWFTVAGHLDFADAMAAVDAHYRGSTERMKVADLLAGVARLGAERQARAVPADPDLDPDDVPAYLAWLRGQRRSIAEADRAALRGGMPAVEQ
jgi:hypothetical protein